jgi:hypothetical protein
MRKFLPYIIALIVVAGLVVLVMNNNNLRSRRMDERLTLRQEDKIPYGTYVASRLLPDMFPRAAISFDRKEPGEWDSVFQSSYNQAAILVCKEFNADDEELYRLLHFARMGNYAFIITNEISSDVRSMFNLTANGSLEGLDGFSEDSLVVNLEHPPYPSPGRYSYPGKRFGGSFYSIDRLRTTVLGRNESGMPNFVRLDVDEGSIFIHMAPLAFSNYFILHKNNIEYFQQALSVIPPTVEKVVWNEYYLVKPKDDSNSSGSKGTDWLRVLMGYPSFRAGLLTALLFLLLMMILESRRKQRMIPVHTRPQNDSLDFIKTIGRLYYDRRDHHNLARKMATYFLEHVRSTYKLPTHTLDDRFEDALHYKSGYDKTELHRITGFIRKLDEVSMIREAQLSSFYNQLELFYQKT